MRRLARWLLLPALLACGEEAGVPPATGAAGPPIPAALPEAASERIRVEVFQRKQVPEAGPGHAILHVLVPAGATQEQVRVALTDVLLGTAEADTTLVALRAIAYALPPVQAGEVTLAPTAWAEWLPPEGWGRAAPASRRAFHRVYTYFGAAPEW